VGSGPLWVAANPKTDTIYVANNGGGLSVINGRTNKVTATIRVGSRPFWVAANPKTKTAYVTNLNPDTVSVLAACHR